MSMLGTSFALLIGLAASPAAGRMPHEPGLAGTSAPAAANATSPVPADATRLVVLGFDGADSRLTQKFLEEGQLPNLAKLRDGGSFFPLRTTNPAQSPVSWAAFNTGMGPETTNIYDFVCRLNEDRTSDLVPKPKKSKPTPALALGYPKEQDSDLHLPAPMRSGTRTLAAVAVGALFFLVFLAIFKLGARFSVLASLGLAGVLGGIGTVALLAMTRWIPAKVPVPLTEMRGTPMWSYLDAAGVPTVGLVVPLSFPFPKEPLPRTKLLAGLGLPDARQSWGDWFLLSTRKERLKQIEETGEMGGVFLLAERSPDRDRGRAKAYEATLEGPLNFWLQQRLDADEREIKARLASGKTTVDENRKLSDRLDAIDRQREEGLRTSVLFEASVEADGKTVAIQIDHRAVTRADGGDFTAGDWSQRFRTSFALNPLLKLSTVVVFQVVSVDPLEIFIKPINLDPHAPPPQAPISSPKGFSAELAKGKGLAAYETLGWACATNALKDEAISDETFLTDIENVLVQHEQLLYDGLARNDWRLLFEVIGVTDRVQHMMMRYYDTAHPLHDVTEAAKEVTFFGKRVSKKDTILEIYRQADRVVGEVMRRVGSDGRTALLVVSDHGFSSFRRGVHLNNWLIAHGYMSVKGGEGMDVDLNDLVNSSGVFGYVDWEKTRAYSLGLGKIYLNIKDREPKGIVPDSEAEALEREIAAKLEADLDPETQRPFVQKAYLARDIYPGHGQNLAPGDRDNAEDIVLGFAEGYRVSWGTALGGVATRKLEGGTEGGPESGGVEIAGYLEPNTQKWSGDHCSVDPSLVSGIFFSSMRLQPPTDADAPDVRHCAPTILHFFGVPVPAGMRAPMVRP